MLVKTSGIVIHTTKYKDSSVIVKIFTEDFGVKSYIANGIRKKSKANKSVFYQPLSIVNIVAYNNLNKEINRISEISFANKYATLHTDIKKISVVFFIAEILHKSLISNYENESIYKYLISELVKFDKAEFNPNFHLKVILEMLPFLGFSMNNLEWNHTNRINRNETLQEVLKLYRENEILTGKIKSLEVLQTIFD